MSSGRQSLPFPVVPPEDINPQRFFEAAFGQFKQAGQDGGNTSRQFIRLGSSVVELKFANPLLATRLGRAISHLRVKEPGVPSLTICVWDDASTHTTMPPPPWTDYTVHDPSGAGRSVYTRRGDVRGFNTERFNTAYNWGAGVLNMMDRAQRIALNWTPDASRVPGYELSAPFRTIFHWCVASQGAQLVHAAALGNDHGGVLIAGKGGSGKSTTALSCLNSELLYASDDYCMFVTEPDPYVYSIYSSAKVNADNLHRVSHAAQALSNKESLETEKAVLFLAEHFSSKLTAGFPIRAILVPLITGLSKTHISPATSMDAIQALALSTMSQLAGAHQASIRKITELAAKVPCYRLELGTELSQIPDAISGLLSQLQGGPASKAMLCRPEPERVLPA